jgi:hypothetical protein
MGITGVDVAVFVVCMLFVGAVFFTKVKKHSQDHLIERRRDRRKPPSR